MILSRKFCVYLYFTSRCLHHGVNKNFKNFTLSEVLFMIFVFFVLCCILSYTNISISSFIIAHSKAPFWAASAYHRRVGHRRPIRLQETRYSHLNIYTIRG